MKIYPTMILQLDNPLKKIPQCRQVQVKQSDLQHESCLFITRSKEGIAQNISISMILFKMISSEIELKLVICFSLSIQSQVVNKLK